MDLYTPLVELRDALRAAGIRAVLDGEDLNPPAVYIAPDRIGDLTGCGGELYAGVWITVGDTTESRAIRQLGPLLGEVSEVLDSLGLPVTEDITTELLQPSAGGTPLPALKVTTSLSV